MKHLIALALLSIASLALADTDYLKYMHLVTPIEGAKLTQADKNFLLFAGRVKGYTKKNNMYVAPHERSAPNSTKLDNYQTEGNFNPNTGKMGTKSGWPK